MPELRFEIDHAEPLRYALAPMLALTLKLSNQPASEQIQSIMLQYQVWIEPGGRQYDHEAQALLLDLFGEPERWSRTVRSLLWVRGTVLIPPFAGHGSVYLDVPCTYDMNVAVAKYFHAVKEGTVPLRVMFSGSVFYEPEEGEEGSIQVSQIPLETEVTYGLSVRTWKEMMDLYYPNTYWLCLEKDLFAQLYRYKVQHGLATWERVFERLLPTEAREGVG
ncbi:MAG: hypothetical protein A4E19_09475 [Nitrospira sp. SG-bin1]|nr:MAG: hypothetical protein A4E19_09475 [Nitrospira sp. SG-bin1]